MESNKNKKKKQSKKRPYISAREKVLAGGDWDYPLKMSNDIARKVLDKQEKLLGANINTILCDALRKGLK